jgi:hypothetical protein
MEVHFVVIFVCGNQVAFLVSALLNVFWLGSGDCLEEYFTLWFVL